MSNTRCPRIKRFPGRKKVSRRRSATKARAVLAPAWTNGTRYREYATEETVSSGREHSQSSRRRTLLTEVDSSGHLASFARAPRALFTGLNSRQGSGIRSTRARETKREKRMTHRLVFFNISLLIVHCRLRDIVISTIHLFTCFIIIIIILIINNNNRNCILLLQIYRFVACVCVVSMCVHTLCYFPFVLYKNGIIRLEGGKKSLQFSPGREQKATICGGGGGRREVE